jgi:hypothetical protein
MNWDSDAKANPGNEGGPVLLIRVFDPVEAEIVVAKLRSSGIETYVRHEALSVVYGLTVDGCGQQDIMVRAGDLEEARAALAAGLEMDPADVPDAAGQDAAGPDAPGPDAPGRPGAAD